MANVKREHINALLIGVCGMCKVNNAVDIREIYFEGHAEIDAIHLVLCKACSDSFGDAVKVVSRIIDEYEGCEFVPHDKDDIPN